MDNLGMGIFFNLHKVSVNKILLDLMSGFKS